MLPSKNFLHPGMHLNKTALGEEERFRMHVVFMMNELNDL